MQFLGVNMKNREISGATSCKILDETNDNISKNFKKQEIVIDKKTSANIVYRDIDSDKAVLYIHGFSDFFYNEELATKYWENDFAFYALDLREHGRSIRDDGKRFYIERVEDYFKEIDVAIYKMLATHNKVILQGFSMGGLVTSLYMKKGFYRSHIDAAILVSPLFKFSTNTFQDYFVRPVVLGLAKFFPFLKYSVDTEKYKEYITRISMDHEHLNHKNIPLYFGWFRAMYDGIAQLEEGLDIKKPLLVMSSDKSEKNIANYKHNSDILLDVNDMKSRSKLLGPDVTYIAIEDAVHDIFVSNPKSRKKAYEQLFEWIKISC